MKLIFRDSFGIPLLSKISFAWPVEGACVPDCSELVVFKLQEKKTLKCRRSQENKNH